MSASTAKDNAGVTYYSGSIYFIGRRTPSTLFKQYSIRQDKWFTAPNYLYPVASSEIATYKDRLYVLGGQGQSRKWPIFDQHTGLDARKRHAF